MNYPYDLHSWSKHYREEAMAKATNRHLAERGRTERRVGYAISASVWEPFWRPCPAGRDPQRSGLHKVGQLVAIALLPV